MTGVYSGGLVYEYSMEDNGYGLVKINGNSVEETDDFKALKEAFAGTKNPSGDGNYKKDGGASQCPAGSKTWDVTMKNNELPAVPSGANDLFKKGAGDGPGLKGDGSQQAGSSESNVADAGDGAVTSGGVIPSGTGGSSKPSGSEGAGAALRPLEFSFAPLVCGAVVIVSSIFGGALIL
jgi:hypothetical protein